MDRKFGYYIVLGLLVGAVFEFGVGTANENSVSFQHFSALAPP